MNPIIIWNPDCGNHHDLVDMNALADLSGIQLELCEATSKYLVIELLFQIFIILTGVS